MKEKSLAELLEELSSGEPTPGGGAVAALAGSLAASLVSMVANLTCGKRGYEDVKEEMERSLEEAQELRDRLAGLSAQDVAAFNGVMAAYRLPKVDPARPQRIEEALEEACAVPLEVAECCLRVLELSEIVAARGNRNAVSDAGAAAVMAGAGLEIALLNVEANLQSMEDERFKKEQERRREELAAAGAHLRERALLSVRGRLKG